MAAILLDVDPEVGSGTGAGSAARVEDWEVQVKIL